MHQLLEGSMKGTFYIVAGVYCILERKYLICNYAFVYLHESSETSKMLCQMCDGAVTCTSTSYHPYFQCQFCGEMLRKCAFSWKNHLYKCKNRPKKLCDCYKWCDSCFAKIVNSVLFTFYGCGHKYCNCCDPGHAPEGAIMCNYCRLLLS